ncbi:MAG: hypothetical protein K940chlam8_00681, partial [Chlamydiae bacterium]|nr:hypothetical protein [Chlamydiota bacterium]
CGVGDIASKGALIVVTTELRVIGSGLIMDGAWRAFGSALFSKGNFDAYDHAKDQENRYRKPDRKYDKVRRNVGDNVRQDKQANDGLKEIKRIYKREGKTLRIPNEEAAKILHREISKKGFNYQELVEEGYWVLEQQFK